MFVRVPTNRLSDGDGLNEKRASPSEYPLNSGATPEPASCHLAFSQSSRTSSRPHGGQRRLLGQFDPLRTAAVGLAACLALLVVAGARADNPETLRGQAEVLAEQNQTLAALEENALLELFALESDLANADQRANTLSDRLATLEQEHASAKAQHAAAEKARNSAQRQLADQLTTLYIQGDIDPLAILLGSESLSDAISAIDELNRLAELNDEIISEVIETEAALEHALQALKEKRDNVKSAAEEVDQALATLAAQKLERSAYIERLAADRALNDQRIAELSTEAEAAERRAQELNAAAAAVAEAIPASSTAPQESASSGGASASTPPAPPPAPPGTGIEPGTTLVVDAVAYSLPGYTASGLPVGPGVVAVDPSVIPLGTRMYIPGYGEGIAADTGSAIIGNIIDLWFPTHDQAAAWGRKTVTITIR